MKKMDSWKKKHTIDRLSKRVSKCILYTLYKIDNTVEGIWVNSLMWSLSALHTLPHNALIWWLGTDVSKIKYFLCMYVYNYYRL